MQVAADFVDLPDLLLVAEYIHICLSQEFIVMWTYIMSLLFMEYLSCTQC
jgi:hypothetical protein